MSSLTYKERKECEKCWFAVTTQGMTEAEWAREMGKPRKRIYRNMAKYKRELKG